MNTLILNRGYRLPNIGYSSLAIDTVENRFLVCGSSNGDIFVADLCQLIQQKPEAVGFYNRGQRSGESVFLDFSINNVTTFSSGHTSLILHCDWFKNDAASFLTASRDHSVKVCYSILDVKHDYFFSFGILKTWQ